MPNSTTFSSEHQPGKRGPAKKTLMLNAIKRKSLLGVSPNASREEVEQAFFDEWVDRALDSKDICSGTIFNALVNKIYPNVKPVNEPVKFDFDPHATPAQRAMQIMTAASNGQLEPDIAALFVRTLGDVFQIEVGTDLKARIEEIEAMAGINKA